MDARFVLVDPSSKVLSDKNGLLGVVHVNKDILRNVPALTY